MSMRPAILVFATVLAPLAATSGELHGQEGPLRGGAFEFTPVLGFGSFQGKSRLDSCLWFGVRIGHRFTPFKGNERLQLGFRTGWEGCSSRHSEVGGVDLIHLNATVLFGFRLSRAALLYWGAGLGELLADTTVGEDNQVKGRFAGHTGPGVTWALGRHLLLDASVKGILFEDFDLGSAPAGGSTLGVVPSLILGVQI
ncbi:MAG: hypothetical protein ACE5HQ_07190 [Gemmatimonadota bacterium]